LNVFGIPIMMLIEAVIRSPLILQSFINVKQLTNELYSLSNLKLGNPNVLRDSSRTLLRDWTSSHGLGLNETAYYA